MNFSMHIKKFKNGIFGGSVCKAKITKLLN